VTGDHLATHSAPNLPPKRPSDVMTTEPTFRLSSTAIGPAAKATAAHSVRSTTTPQAGAATPSTVASDAALVKAMREGDREAFADMVRSHQSAIYGYLRARLLEPADVEDLCQEVFFRCLAGRAKLRADLRLRPWLIGVARNVLREHVRKVRRRKEVAWTELCLELDTLTLHAVGDDDAIRRLPDCMRELGQSAQEALTMRYRGNLKLAEIGKRLGKSEGAVKLLMYRARQALKLCLDRKLRATRDE
jgi:RNA polymerase sigma-70 factor (ECF subfamily)